MKNAISPDDLANEYARKMIVYKAMQLSSSRGFLRHEREDLEQELWVALFAQSESFDPDRGCLNTFINRVVNSAVAMLRRERRSEKHPAGSEVCSLDDRPDRSCNHYQDSLAESSDRRRNQTDSYLTVYRAESREAFDFAIQSMPRHTRDVCHHVQMVSLAGAARHFGISRRQVRNELASAAECFRIAGIEHS